MWQNTILYFADAISGRENCSSSHFACALLYGSKLASPNHFGWASGLSSPVSSPAHAHSRLARCLQAGAADFQRRTAGSEERVSLARRFRRNSLRGLITAVKRTRRERTACCYEPSSRHTVFMFPSTHILSSYLISERQRLIGHFHSPFRPNEESRPALESQLSSSRNPAGVDATMFASRRR